MNVFRVIGYGLLITLALFLLVANLPSNRASPVLTRDSLEYLETSNIGGMTQVVFRFTNDGTRAFTVSGHSQMIVSPSIETLQRLGPTGVLTPPRRTGPLFADKLVEPGGSALITFPLPRVDSKWFVSFFLQPRAAKTEMWRSWFQRVPLLVPQAKLTGVSVESPQLDVHGHVLQYWGARRQPYASRSGKYYIRMPIEPAVGVTRTSIAPVWKVTILGRDGEVLYKDENSRMPANRRIRVGWDDQDRVWAYSSGDGRIWRWELTERGWTKAEATRSDGIPVVLLPEHEAGLKELTSRASDRGMDAPTEVVGP